MDEPVEQTPPLPQPGGEPTQPADPPFTEVRWEAPSARVADWVAKGVTVTLRITPYLITVWLFAPADMKHALRMQARWLPWAVKYAAWWLRQEGW